MYEILPPIRLPPQRNPTEPKPLSPRYGLAGLLFAITFVFTTTLGAFWSTAGAEAMEDGLEPFWTSPHLIAAVWGDQALRSAGLWFSVPLLTILLCHELGHYLACRYYRVPATLPYFLPLPLGLGTLGAFIKIKGWIRHKVELFDIGVAGPLAGFVALVPFLLYGIAHSPVVAPEPGPPDTVEVALGLNPATRLAILAIHGPLPEGMVLQLHPAALAAWVGLLATALNLLPLGQLDGGHVLYAALGRWQERLALPFWLALVVGGFFWPVWWIWCLFVLRMGLSHPPVMDEERPLDFPRRVLAVVALVVFLLSFTAIPVRIIPS